MSFSPSELRVLFVFPVIEINVMYMHACIMELYM